jgi:recombination protein RecT
MSNLVTLINGDTMRKEFQKAFGSEKMLTRFLRLATSTINQTPRLKDCSQESVVGALLKSAQLNLEPNTVLGECYLIPRQNKGKWEANFELGYKGIIKLAYRSGDVKMIQAYEVYENDTFDVDYGQNKLIHKPMIIGYRGNVIAYWARYIMKDGTSDFKVWSKSDIDAHRDQYSKSARSDYSPWSTAYDQMAKKTVIKDVLRYAPSSVEDYGRAVAADQQVIEVRNEQKELPEDKRTVTELFKKPQLPATAETPEKDADWKEAFDYLQAAIAGKIADGVDIKAIEDAMGFSFNEADSVPTDKLIEALQALKAAK